MKPLPQIPIIEDYLQYQASRDCYRKKTLQGWRRNLTQTYQDNGGLNALVSIPYDLLYFGTVSSSTLGERRRTVQEFRNWYLNVRQHRAVLV